ncbi:MULTISPECIES: DUF1707 SHOCT-like domain-containing protein [Streptomyces]|uniref:DUF1707 SHOCT-like domain-containing protein n=1 Tax=Streptomyces TaxID=1883 RepID=UPI00287FAF55|nr:DUF1707 domain-containing protein [Streptomyces sp. CGMCC 4.1456]WNF67971.1 DUF1707 domain-containing protein [Streptomyces sp. CGMCC 4.1456]
MAGEVSRTGGSPEVRASHADRDRIVDVLRVAAGDGRLTMEELDERLEAALSARTVGELAVLTTDLPEVVGETVEVEDVVRIEQQGASTRRDDAWVVPRRLEIRSSFGEVTLDFTDAVITQDTLHIDLEMGGGALKLVTRPGVVVDTGSLVLNYSKIKARRAGAAAEAPVVLRVRITGEISFGQVVVRRPRRGFGRRKPAG